jgi:hypothetical protein
MNATPVFMILSPQGSSMVSENDITTSCAWPPAVTRAQDGSTSPNSLNLFSVMRDTRRKNASNGTSADRSMSSMSVFILIDVVSFLKLSASGPPGSVRSPVGLLRRAPIVFKT